jgi:beta-galactosidase
MLADIAGVEVEEFYALLDPVPVIGQGFKGETHIWAERLKILDEAGTTVVARYGESNGWLDGQAAITSHPFGRGCAFYVGAYLDDAAQQQILDHITESAGVLPVMKCPAGVEARKRIHADGNEVLILINHERTEKQVKLPWFAHEHLHGINLRELQLKAYGVAVLTRIEKEETQ